MNALGYRQYACAMPVTSWSGRDPWAHLYQVEQKDMDR